MTDELKSLIEAAVLEAQGKQEPVAWAYTINNSHSVFSAEKPPEDAYDEGTLHPLFAAPVVRPDMVMVPRKPTEVMLEVMAKLQFHAPQERYRAMIAAAEKEQ